MKKTQLITILVIGLAFVGAASPIEVGAAEGRKGLDAINVRLAAFDNWREMVTPGDIVTVVIKQVGDPIPDIDITIDQSPGGTVATGVLTNVFPPGNKRNTGEDQDCDDDGQIDSAPEERARGIGQDPERDTGEDQDCDSAPEEKERGIGIGHTLIIKRAEELPAIEIVLPMTKGTVKFFNEAKSVGGHIIDVLIKVNPHDI
ncbi:MAG: hypothetical protein Q8P45_03385 [Candidatus Harrisonbacteria bacterium]|nr:hypothetical protein [Candidatus Harrisonbacteria bacterium]